ncbi:MAG: hypothetical protein AB1656_20975 [Candidatus Omnitrophota bacterium]
MLKLSENQKYILIRLLKDLALQDRNFDGLEAIRIRTIGLKMDMAMAKIDEAFYEDFQTVEQILDSLGRFETAEQKNFVYQQCASLLMSDRKISSEEQSTLEQLRQALAIGEEKHRQILTWVQEGMEWEKRGEELAGGSLEDS